jgi:RimJ/RimL family protein N-acetyltransferase
MRFHFGDSQVISEWVAAHIPHVDGFEGAATIGILDDDGVPLGAVVYHEYRGNDIQLSCAADSPRWLNRKALATIFRYPFVQLKCSRVTAMTPSKNTNTRQFLERVGFKQEGIMRQGFVSDDCVVYGMLRSECKWINGDNDG